MVAKSYRRPSCPLIAPVLLSGSKPMTLSRMASFIQAGRRQAESAISFNIGHDQADYRGNNRNDPPDEIQDIDYLCRIGLGRIAGGDDIGLAHGRLVGIGAMERSSPAATSSITHKCLWRKI